MAKGEETTGIQPAAAGLTRREVVGIGVVAAAGVVGLSVPVAAYLQPGAGGGTTGIAEIAAEDLHTWDAMSVVVAQRPVAVVRTPTEIHAVGSRCTHLSCIVKWQKSRRIFFCPCHGARFAPDGALLGGPAPGPLPPMKVSESGGRIRVELA